MLPLSSLYLQGDVSTKCQEHLRIYLSLYNQEEKTQCNETVVFSPKLSVSGKNKRDSSLEWETGKEHSWDLT